VKNVNKKFIESGDVIVYSVRYYNFTENPNRNLKIYDLLPCNGDERGTSGSDNIVNEIKSISISSENAFTCNIFATETQQGDVDTFSEDNIIYDGNTSQTTHTITVNNLNYKEIGAVIDEVSGGSFVTLTITMKTQNDNADYFYANNAFVWHDTLQGFMKSNTVYTRVISRSVSGTVWVDGDVDGRRDDEETLLNNVEVSLLKYNETTREWEIAKDLQNNPIPSVLTNENGYYEFDNLPSGTYRLLFGNDNQYLTITSKEAEGVETDKNSKAEKINGNIYVAYQNGRSIYLQTLEEMSLNETTAVSIPHLDVGVIISFPLLPTAGNPIKMFVIVIFSIVFVIFFVFLKKQK
jgi:uncharacterized repeat protein (TIGR01451 family)